MTKIFIVGCAKTGTTLVRRLFNAFDLRVCNNREISLGGFLRSDYEVGKRSHDTLFSNRIPLWKQLWQLWQIRRHDVAVIYVSRNSDDVLKSSGGYVSPRRLRAVRLQTRRFWRLVPRFYQLEYEILLRQPDVVQERVSDFLGIEPRRKWSAYPKFIDPSLEDPENLSGSYSLRPIGSEVFTDIQFRPDGLPVVRYGVDRYPWKSLNSPGDAFFVACASDQQKTAVVSTTTSTNTQRRAKGLPCFSVKTFVDGVRVSLRDA
jgi:hypothetical protein